MSKASSRRLLAQSSLTLFPEFTPTSRLPLRCPRPFSSTSRRRADGDDASNTSKPLASHVTPSANNILSGSRRDQASYTPLSPSLNPKAPMANLASSFFSEMISQNNNDRTNRNRRRLLDTERISSDGSLLPTLQENFEEPHHFHIYATRHNTHITVTDPTRNPIISVSAGNIGFRKSGRKHYDSAFQLASYVMSRLQEQGHNAKIKRLEVVLRGFGAGREAVTKALLGSEGRFLRGKVTKVADATRLKFGGTRSKKPRRLG